MNAILGLIVVGLFAYLGAALMRQRRFPLIVQVFHGSGVAFFGVGFVLGPHGAGLLSLPILDALDTVINLGLGWIGFLFGLQLRFYDLRKVPGRHYLAALVQALIAYGVVAFGLYLLLRALAPSELGASGVLATVFGLAAIAATSTPTIPALVCQDMGARGPLGPVLQLVTSFDALPAVLTLGVASCFEHPVLAVGMLGGFLSLGIALGVGLLVGALFHLLTLVRYNDDQLLVLILGAVVFTAGAAHYLELSPLLVSLVAGSAVANLAQERHRTLRVFLSAEKPIYLLMLALAGALWAPTSLALLALAAAFVLLRIVGKLTGGLLVGPVAGIRVQGRWGMGLGLLGHGGMAVALAVCLQQNHTGPVGNVVLTATIVSVFATTLLAPVTTRRLLCANEEAP